MPAEAVSAWRQALGPNWEEVRSITDWMGLEMMHDHVAMLHTGAPRPVGGDWIDHALRTHLLPLAKRLAERDGQGDRKLSMVSFGSGTGTIERAVLERGWPIHRLVCREYDTELLKMEQKNVAGLCPDQAFQQFDFNNPELVGDEQFDVAFFCHSMHHCTDLERFLPFLSRIIAPGGIVLGLDYFGPSRLQVNYDVRVLLDEIFDSLPEHLRLNLVTGEVDDRLYIDPIQAVAQADPSEAPRSADLRSLLFSSFPVREIAPMGGTLLRPLLARRAGNFRSPSDNSILKLLTMLERELIRSGRLSSDNLFFVLEPSDRL